MEVQMACMVEGDVLDVLQVGDNKWVLSAPIVYTITTDCGVNIHTVPKGFECDMASIPAIVLPLFGKKPRIMQEAAVLHDYLYVNKEVKDRLYADDVMMMLMKNYNNPKEAWKRALIYSAVRAWGWTGFKK